MIWMDVDTALGAVPINLVALIDSTDFVTREESVTYDQAGLDLVWCFTTTAGVYTQTAVTPTDTGGDYDWINQGNGDYTIEIPATGGASINNDAEGFGHFKGFATGILPWTGPTIGFRAAAINNALIDGGDNLDVNAVEISGDATAADNLELACDNYSVTRGLTGTALPDAVSDAGGGVPISDAGGLDLDAIKTATDRLTAVRAAVLTDWINDGRLDVLLDAIPTTAMRGTDNALLASTFSTMFSGITALAQWLGLIAGKQTGNATALTELKATGAGSGTYNPTTDSTEAIRDNALSAVNTALDTAIPELGVAVPSATPTLRTGLMLGYMSLRNKFITQTSGTDAIEIHNDAGVKITKKLLDDDGSDYIESKMS